MVTRAAIKASEVLLLEGFRSTMLEYVQQEFAWGSGDVSQVVLGRELVNIAQRSI
jgi:hypothetical protein